MICCMLLSASGGIISGVLSTFIKPVSEQLQVSRAEFSLTSTVINLTIMLIMPFVAKILKCVPLKRTIIFSACISGTAIFCFSFAKNLAEFYLLSAICGFFSCFMNAVPIVILTSNWFREKRGVATSISFSGMGLSSMLLSPIAASVIEAYSWQTAYRVVGISFLLLSVPSSVFLIREKPQEIGLEPLGGQQAGQEKICFEGFEHRQVIRMKSFWLFAAAIALIPLTSYGVQQHAISYWSDLGYSATKAASWYSVMMAIGIVSKASMGAVYEKWKIRKASAFVCLAACASYILMIFCANPVALVLMVVLFGISSGIQITPPTYITNRLFGDRDYSMNYGTITMIYYLGMACGVPFSAFCYDRFHSYLPAWCIYSVLMLAVLVLIFKAERCARKEWIQAFGTAYDGADA
ncbi:MAG: MFS transporter [Firmicutes bacterium]|nr:MFS transporter [Bacillota bacterium]